MRSLARTAKGLTVLRMFRSAVNGTDRARRELKRNHANRSPIRKCCNSLLTEKLPLMKTHLLAS